MDLPTLRVATTGKSIPEPRPISLHEQQKQVEKELRDQNTYAPNVVKREVDYFYAGLGINSYYFEHVKLR